MFASLLQHRLKRSAIPLSVAMPASIHDGFPAGPLTPPDAPEAPSKEDKDISSSSLITAIHVISTERAALAHLEQLYQTDSLAQENLVRAVNQIVRSIQDGGKLVLCGVGKSGKIARKIEATMNSLGIFSIFLHPAEALHGDLGIIRENDTLLLISFSGRTQELLLLLPHIPPTVPVIAITSHLHPATCPILSLHSSDMAIALPAPIHEDEESSFGVGAPTSSTTVALSLGDALALATARRLHTSPSRGPAEVFKSFHPGGAIGAATAAAAGATPISMASTASSFTLIPSADYLQSQQTDGQEEQNHHQQENREHQDLISNHLIPLDKIPTVSATSGNHETRLLDILLIAIQHPDAKSWVSISPSSSRFTLIPPRHIHSLASSHSVDMTISAISTLGLPFSVSQEHFLCVPASSTVDEVRGLVNANPSSSSSSQATVIAGMDEPSPGVCLGVMDVQELWTD